MQTGKGSTRTCSVPTHPFGRRDSCPEREDLQPPYRPATSVCIIRPNIMSAGWTIGIYKTCCSRHTVCFFSSWPKTSETRRMRKHAGSRKPNTHTHLVEIARRFYECRPPGRPRPPGRAIAGLCSPGSDRQFGGAESWRRCRGHSCWSGWGQREKCPHGVTWDWGEHKEKAHASNPVGRRVFQQHIQWNIATFCSPKYWKYQYFMSWIINKFCIPKHNFLCAGLIKSTDFQSTSANCLVRRVGTGKAGFSSDLTGRKSAILTQN